MAAAAACGRHRAVWRRAPAKERLAFSAALPQEKSF